MPMAFSKRTYRMLCTQPLGVNAAVDSVTTTGRCTSAHSGIDTCSGSNASDKLLGQMSAA